MTKIPEKNTIHFTHANGFTSGCYRFFLEQLENEYNIGAIPKVGHDPRYPITSQWDFLVEQIKESIEATQKKYNSGPIIGMGHSLGALLTLLCAQKYPHLFQQIIIVEPPVSTGFDLLFWRLIKLPGLQDEFSPAKASRNRQVVFPSREIVAKRFKGKRFFKHFHSECFDDFIEHCFEDCDDGIRLAFEREYEVAIFRTLPDRGHLYNKPTTMPATIITGKHSDLHQFGVLKRSLKNLSYLNHHEMETGHLVPMEKPLELASLIKRIIEEQRQS